jgi:YVTN family beta-propeller protein
MNYLPAFLLPLLLAFAQTPEKPVRAVVDAGVVTTRQAITPAGAQTIFSGRVHGIAFGEAPSELWVLTKGQGDKDTQISRLDWNANRLIEKISIKENPGLQGIQLDPVSRRPLVSATLPGGGGQPQGQVRLLSIDKDKAVTIADSLGGFIAGALAVAPRANSLGQRLSLVPLIFNNKLALVDLTEKAWLGSVDTGIAPFGAVINSTGTVAYVSNWGGRLPRPQDLTLPTGLAPNADRVVVDNRGIASTGTVTRIDLNERRPTHTIPVELHPMAMVWDETRARLYVANGNKDSVSVIDTKSNRVTATFAIQPFTKVVAGIAPNAVTISADGSVLYVACGGINAVAVVDAVTGKIRGLIPTGWYPNAVIVSPDDKYIAVGSLLGAGSGWRDDPKQRFVHSYRGSINVVAVPDEAQLASLTKAVAENNRLESGPARVADRTVRNSVPVAVPARTGDASLIDHVVYIIKENRTYDQVLGDMSKGNSDPSLVLFGNDVTPNQHQLADRFVLLDNFFATGGNSADGHQWVTQANETAYALWPGYTGRSYPFDGTDPIAYSSSGFIWDLALQMRKTVRIFGEYAGRLTDDDHAQRKKLLERWKAGGQFVQEWNTTAPLQPLNKILAKNYPPYSLSVPDVVRSQIFLKDLKAWEDTGDMPNLVIIALPSNHTLGTTPDASTPKAMAADNDLALGQIVAGLSHSRFWKSMAIFVVEDDAQNGVDHVDGHRTVALAISPYIRRGHVDSAFYSHPSILKTIELMLGLPTLSLFDLIANDMRASFTNSPDLTPYEAVMPEQSLFEVNPPLKGLRGDQRRWAQASLKMRFDIPDAAPTERLNRILWHQIKGSTVPYPTVKQAIFAPLSIDIDDDEREERKEETRQ